MKQKHTFWPKIAENRSYRKLLREQIVYFTEILSSKLRICNRDGSPCKQNQIKRKDGLKNWISALKKA